MFDDKISASVNKQKLAHMKSSFVDFLVFESLSVCFAFFCYIGHTNNNTQCELIVDYSMPIDSEYLSVSDLL